MYIIIYDKQPNIDGQMDDRPLAVFHDMKNARKFMRLLAVNGIYASMQSFGNVLPPNGAR
jgi:hypothetical protein